MNSILPTIFSYSEGYNYLHRWVCSEFRLLAPEVSVLSFLDVLCRDDRTKLVNLQPSRELGIAAAKRGYVHLLEYNKEQNLPQSLCRMAAKRGHLNVLIWAKDNGFFWSEWAYVDAINNGYEEIASWALYSGCAADGSLYAAAVEHNRGAIIKLAIQKEVGSDDRACKFAAKTGNLSLLMSLRWAAFPWNEKTCAEAAKRGHLEILQWAHANGCP